jgi:lipoprotein-anchoring transpeptidase ErfK/SrfK
VVAPGKGNPLGTRWMGLTAKGYGIHGTNAPKSIGKAASHGCIRVRASDLEELFDLVSVGIVVEIHGERPEILTRILDRIVTD